MEPFRTLISKTVVLPDRNIDTDQIIPARFLKVTQRQGLGKCLFANVRYDQEGNPRPEFVLNCISTSDTKVLVAGDNFGCGSSREHAPWALSDFGFRAVVSTSIADIFRANAIKNGILPVVVPPKVHQKLLDAPGASVTIDLEALVITLPDDDSAQFELDAFSRHCLLNGVDELGLLLASEEAIEAYEERSA